MTDNAKAIEHLQTLVGFFSLADHNKRIDALSWLIDDRARLHAELQRMRARLPEGMAHCTIRFVECPQGHGSLTAGNWVDSGCAWCKLAAANALLVRARRHIPLGLLDQAISLHLGHTVVPLKPHRRDCIAEACAPGCEAFEQSKVKP